MQTIFEGQGAWHECDSCGWQSEPMWADDATAAPARCPECGER